MADIFDRAVSKKIEGFENYYIFSNGKVYSENKKGFLKLNSTQDGYKQITLHNNGRTKTFKVHRLVAFYFIPNPHKKEQVNHIDEDKTNNDISNLEWLTHKENMNFGTRNERISKKMINLTSKKVKQFSKDGELINVFDGLSDAERKTGISATNICKVDKGKRKSAGGYIWEIIR